VPSKWEKKVEIDEHGARAKTGHWDYSHGGCGIAFKRVME